MRLFRFYFTKYHSVKRLYNTLSEGSLNIQEKHFITDSMTNITPKILSLVGKNLHLQRYHPLSLIRENVVNYFYKTFKTRSGNPIFSVFDTLNPVVTVEANFDSLLVPPEHVSRSKSDCYYVNSDYLLRAHMTAHQSELIRAGLNSFLMIGDVYRRDEIDSSHYPVFHQVDAVRLLSPEELYVNEDDGREKLRIMEEEPSSVETIDKQACYTLRASHHTETQLKQTLEGLCRHLFGSSIRMRWVDAYFPFTHPSWELEIELNSEWVEVLGCGIMRYPILQNAGVSNRIGWAFGLGLERLAMILYKIPDIRLFWSRDSGFLGQFEGKSPSDSITYKTVSQFPQCMNDISFWTPRPEFSHNDFYDLARDIAGDLLERVQLIDVFKDPKTGRVSHCYRLIYRHMERTLTKEEANEVHRKIEQSAAQSLNVIIR